MERQPIKLPITVERNGRRVIDFDLTERISHALEMQRARAIARRTSTKVRDWDTEAKEEVWCPPGNRSGNNALRTQIEYNGSLDGGTPKNPLRVARPQRS